MKAREYRRNGWHGPGRAGKRESARQNTHRLPLLQYVYSLLDLAEPAESFRVAVRRCCRDRILRRFTGRKVRKALYMKVEVVNGVERWNVKSHPYESVVVNEGYQDEYTNETYFRIVFGTL